METFGNCCCCCGDRRPREDAMKTVANGFADRLNGNNISFGMANTIGQCCFFLFLFHRFHNARSIRTGAKGLSRRKCKSRCTRRLRTREIPQPTRAPRGTWMRMSRKRERGDTARSLQFGSLVIMGLKLYLPYVINCPSNNDASPRDSHSWFVFRVAYFTPHIYTHTHTHAMACRWFDLSSLPLPPWRVWRTNHDRRAFSCGGKENGSYAHGVRRQ